MSINNYSCLNNSFNLKGLCNDILENFSLLKRSKLGDYVSDPALYHSKEICSPYKYYDAGKKEEDDIPFDKSTNRKDSEQEEFLKNSQLSLEAINSDAVEKESLFIKDNENPILLENELLNLSGYVIFDSHDSSSFTEKEWTKIANGGLEEFSYSKISRSLQQGIPYHLRKNIWAILANIEKLKEKYNTFDYHNDKNRINPKLEKIIKWDVFRTKSFHLYFNGEERDNNHSEGLDILKKVLTAYANFDKDLGYTQGMNFIAGILLIYLNLENDPSVGKDYVVIDDKFEENTFWILVHILKEIGWREVLKVDTPFFKEMMDTVDKKIKSFFPDIYLHIRKHDLTTELCFTQEIMTIFLLSSPREYAKRILDIFLYEGSNSIYMILLRFLQICREDILKIKDPEALKDFLKSKLVARAFEKFNIGKDGKDAGRMADWYEPLDLSSL